MIYQCGRPSHFSSSPVYFHSKSDSSNCFLIVYLKFLHTIEHLIFENCFTAFYLNALPVLQAEVISRFLNEIDHKNITDEVCRPYAEKGPFGGATLLNRTSTLQQNSTICTVTVVFVFINHGTYVYEISNSWRTIKLE